MEGPWSRGNREFVEWWAWSMTQRTGPPYTRGSHSEI
jgi:hypothetical protein